MFETSKLLAKLATELDENGYLDWADQIDDIENITTDVDVASGQHMPAGDAQWTHPTVCASLSKKSMGLMDVPIGDLDYANRQGIPDDDMDKQLFSGEEDGVSMPPINRKYHEVDDMEIPLKKLEEYFKSHGLYKQAKDISAIRIANLGGPITTGGTAGTVAGASAGTVGGLTIGTALGVLFPPLLPVSTVLGSVIGAFSGGIAGKYTGEEIQAKIKKYLDDRPPQKEELMRVTNRLREIRNTLITKYKLTEPEIESIIAGRVNVNSLISSKFPGKDEKELVALISEYDKLVKRFTQIISEGLKEETSSDSKGISEGEPVSTGRIEESSPAKTRGNNSVAKLQKLIGVTSDGIWGPETSEAWNKFINNNKDEILKEFPEADLEATKNNWPAVAKFYKLTPDAIGILQFAQAIVNTSAEAPAVTPEAVTPEETPAITSDEVLKALTMLSTSDEPHMSEGNGKTVKSLDGVISNRRTNRYIRHLGKVADGDGNDIQNVANLMVSRYGDAMQAELQTAKKTHEATDMPDYNAKHRADHLNYIVYKYLQRAWGALSKNPESSRRDERAARRERKQENRGQRRLAR